MAETAKTKHKGDGEVDKPGHNSEARKKLTAEVFQKMFKKEQDIEKAMVLHVKDLKDDLARMKKNLKADVDVDLKYLMPNYKLYKLEQEALLMEDDDGRSDALQGLRLSFESLQHGGIVDFIKVLEEPDENEEES